MPEPGGGRTPSERHETNAEGFGRAAARLRRVSAANPRRGRPRHARIPRPGRIALATGIVAAAAVIAYRQQETPPPPAPTDRGRVVFVDVEGWYRRTPHEVAAMTPHALSLESLPAGLPLRLGHWRGIDRPHDPAIDEWFRDPEVAIERTYTHPDGDIVWLSAFGSRGRTSFHLFEHTPEVCYPLGGWRIERFGTQPIAMGPLPLTVNLGEAVRHDGRLVFMYFYVWDTPARDTGRGVLTVRLAAPVRDDVPTTVALLSQDFLPELFPTTVPWTRF